MDGNIGPCVNRTYFIKCIEFKAAAGKAEEFTYICMHHYQCMKRQWLAIRSTS